MPHPDPLTGFRRYLASLPDDLLTSFTRCYTWLAGLRFIEGSPPTGLDLRRDCCLEECARRNLLRPIRLASKPRCQATGAGAGSAAGTRGRRRNSNGHVATR